MIQVEEHRFQGMRRDNHPINQDANFLWDAYNIRLTNRYDNTLMSITNERGTDPISIDFNGYYVGHCVVDKYIVVFTTDSDGVGYIYRLNEEYGAIWNPKLLYKGKDLKFSVDHPITTIADIESDLIHKVYWVDGINQPRVINITRDKLIGKEDDFESTYPSVEIFNFVPNLKLEEEITVNTIYSGGQFPAGVIQYAFSYYNKYGQESNIFYTTELLPVTINDKGVSPEGMSTCSFSITVKKLDNLFTHLRIYSIHRTSIDADPIVKVVKDLDITGISSITYTDTGLEGSATDVFKILYTGGETIVANAIASKDGTMFLADITQNIDKIDLEINDNNVTIEDTTVNHQLQLDNSTASNYKNYTTSDNICGFKHGETYRLGLQFQYNNGKWSEPIFIKDHIIESKPILEDGNLALPSINVTINNIDSNTLDYIKSKAKNVRGVIVAPDMSHRTVLAQGILCPTVFNVGNRYNNTPFSQSSWFTRLAVPKEKDENPTLGTIPQYKHFGTITGSGRDGEIQCSRTNVTFNQINEIVESNDSMDNVYVVDQSVLTFHSPDLEQYAASPYLLRDAKLRIVGLSTFTASLGDIDIRLASPGIKDTSNGFIHRQNSVDYGSTIDAGARGIVSGLYYEDTLVTYSDNTFVGKSGNIGFLIYPWHREGSLNNDIVRNDNGTRTAVLKQKTISNLRFSNNTIWLDENQIWKPSNGSNVALFTSDQMTLAKLESPWGSSSRINYYGNVDTLVYSTSGYPIMYASGAAGQVGASFTRELRSTVTMSDSEIGSQGGLKASYDPCRIKYKSTPHAIVSLNYIKSNGTVTGMEILPHTIGSSLWDSSTGKIKPFWITQKRNLTQDEKPTNIFTLKYYNEEWEIGTGVNGNITYNIKGKTPNVGDLLCNRPPEGYEMDHHGDYVGDPTKYYLWRYSTTGSFELIGYGYIDHYYTDRYYRYEQSNPELIGTTTLWWKLEYDGVYNIMNTTTAPDTTSTDNGVSVVGDGLYVQSDGISINTDYPYLWVAELYLDVDKIYGDSEPNTLRNQLWIPAGPPVPLNGNNITVQYKNGDTWYNRYDCLKTYAYTEEDTNSIIDIVSFMCESRVNLQGRYDNNMGQINNLLMSPLNFNKMNPVYSQLNNVFNYRVLDSDIYLNNHLYSTIVFSLQKNPMSIIDNWTGINMVSSVSADSIFGKVNSLNVVNDQLVYLQENAVGIIPFNVRTQIPTADGVPIQISNNYRVDNPITIKTGIGCKDKMASINTPAGLFFIDYATDTLYNYNGNGFEDISGTRGLQDWFKTAHPDRSWRFPYIWNKNGIKLCYDTKNQDLYCITGLDDNTKSECLCFSTKIGQFVSEMSYKGSVFIDVYNSTSTGLYSLYFNDETNKTQMYENFKGDYNNIFGKTVNSSITFISNSNPSINKIFDNIEYRADFYTQDGDLISNKSFNKLEASNEYQHGLNILDNRNLRKKFRVWRALVPRQGRERMRNMWTKLKFEYTPKKNETDNFILHDLNVKYTI